MNEKLQIVFGLLGGLAIFLYGMNMMSELSAEGSRRENEDDSCITLQRIRSLVFWQVRLQQQCFRAAVQRQLWQLVLSVQDL